MTSRKYRLSRIAEVELLELWTYLFEQSLSEQRADKVIGNIVLKFANLAEFPLRAGLLYQNQSAAMMPTRVSSNSGNEQI